LKLLQRATRRQEKQAAWSVGLISILLLGTPGCSDSSTPGPRLLDGAGALREYVDAQAQLRLPAGAGWPEATPVLTPSEGAGVYESGVGLQEAQSVWYCAWARAALSGSTGQRSDALEMLSEFPEQFGAKGKFSMGDDGLRSYFTKIEGAAVLGDLSPLSGHVTDNCS
jgi:hypothetical protein